MHYTSLFPSRHLDPFVATRRKTRPIPSLKKSLNEAATLTAFSFLSEEQWQERNHRTHPSCTSSCKRCVTNDNNVFHKIVQSDSKLLRTSYIWECAIIPTIHLKTSSKHLVVMGASMLDMHFFLYAIWIHKLYELQVFSQLNIPECCG